MKQSRIIKQQLVLLQSLAVNMFAFGEFALDVLIVRLYLRQLFLCKCKLVKQDGHLGVEILIRVLCIGQLDLVLLELALT